ncbi:pyridoxamine 5'-phosphate oxidase family protein [Vibrio cholerae]|nr:pyridoxamine 5'-phosphate oxidase family protein [Vibrio cholerae]EKF9078892.1 pyridoxamine 5'-phosphate oxidase family protein [Vibrio cholerae]
MKELCSLEEVRQVIGDPNPLASKKIYTTLNSRMQEFIKTSPLLMLSTVDEFGFPTISPKGDIAGFVKVRDANTILLPELRGNKLAFSRTTTKLKHNNRNHRGSMGLETLRVGSPFEALVSFVAHCLSMTF